MNRFYVIPSVEDGKGKIRVFQSEHNGRTRSIYEEEDVTAKRFRYLADGFTRQAQELEALEKQREYTKAARELNEEVWGEE